jgi:CHAD domain-containing protein
MDAATGAEGPVAAPLDVPDLGPHSSIGDVARAAFASSVERLARHGEALRDADDEEAVHQARVAVRRMRSDLRTFAPVLDEPWADGLRERMRRLQDGFSQARDADVLLAHLQHEAHELPDADRRDGEAVFEPFRAARERAYEQMRAMLGEPRYAALLEELARAATHPPVNSDANAPACDVLGAIVGGAWTTLRKRVRARSRPPADAELHAIRIAAKRARYAAEAVAPVAGRRAHALAASIEKIQTVLGEQHDAAEARERLRSLAHGAHAFRAGELAALAHRTACAKAVAWRGAWRDAKRCYRRFRAAL